MTVRKFEVDFTPTTDGHWESSLWFERELAGANVREIEALYNGSDRLSCRNLLLDYLKGGHAMAAATPKSPEALANLDCTQFAVSEFVKLACRWIEDICETGEVTQRQKGFAFVFEFDDEYALEPTFISRWTQVRDPFKRESVYYKAEPEVDLLELARSC